MFLNPSSQKNNNFNLSSQNLKNNTFLCHCLTQGNGQNKVKKIMFLN